MKITVLYGAPPNYSIGLAGIINDALNVLTELGLEIEQVDLSSEALPFFDGRAIKKVDNIIEHITKSAGVIVATTSVTSGPSGLLQNFFDYCSIAKYRKAFENKNCMLIVVTEKDIYRNCIEVLSHTLYSFGAYDPVRVCLTQNIANSIPEQDELRNPFEKQLEDFFRIIRQNRKFFIPSPFIKVEPENKLQITDSDKIILESIENKQKIPLSEIEKKLALNSMDENMTRDINEISRFFAKRFNEPEPSLESTPIFIESAPRDPASITSHSRTSKQLSQNLPKHFQPQFAQNLTATIQLFVSGEENFTCYYTIKNLECTYTDGSALHPDITINMDSTVWSNILNGSYSAQKAFMIGRLKVKGNYVILTKFDRLFQLHE